VDEGVEVDDDRSPRSSLDLAVRGPALALGGAIVAAVGVGLVPHVVKQGFAFPSVVSVASLVLGLTAVVAGTRTTLRGRRLLVRGVGVLSALVVTGLAVSVVAPGVAATNVPPTQVTRTPASLGLDHEAVTVTTSDGVHLAGWFLSGTNGAAVVVRHGAGSTRSSVLDQAVALHDAGYGVLLLDARGHGESGGEAMDFGWYGDLDIAAGTAFLAAQDGIDAGRIGVVGFSMGGEEAIGAAATDPLVRAVVAEGATGRQADDKAWLSDAFGWRGWIQERLEDVQYAVTDLLTPASPPTALRAAVAVAADTAFLLITAGEVDDERRAAAHIRSGAPEQVTVWEVEGAGHTDGYEHGPDQWRDRVVTFLDTALR
jgi:pimeloyl-ACP methyl ester carboxylesterase